MKRILGGIVILIGVAGFAGAIAALAGVIEIPTRRGPLGLLAISAVFTYVGWNWVQNKSAQ